MKHADAHHTDCGSVLQQLQTKQGSASSSLCRVVGRMDLIRYGSIQTPHRRSITGISASLNAQRDK